jgi:hypothetical protein
MYIWVMYNIIKMTGCMHPRPCSELMQPFLEWINDMQLLKGSPYTACHRTLRYHSSGLGSSPSHHCTPRPSISALSSGRYPAFRLFSLMQLMSPLLHTRQLPQDLRQAPPPFESPSCRVQHKKKAASNKMPHVTAKNMVAVFPVMPVTEAGQAT